MGDRRGLGSQNLIRQKDSFCIDFPDAFNHYTDSSPQRFLTYNLAYSLTILPDLTQNPPEIYPNLPKVTHFLCCYMNIIFLWNMFNKKRKKMKTKANPTRAGPLVTGNWSGVLTSRTPISREKVILPD